MTSWNVAEATRDHGKFTATFYLSYQKQTNSETLASRKRILIFEMNNSDLRKINRL